MIGKARLAIGLGRETADLMAVRFAMEPRFDNALRRNLNHVLQTFAETFDVEEEIVSILEVTLDAALNAEEFEGVGSIFGVLIDRRTAIQSERLELVGALSGLLP